MHHALPRTALLTALLAALAAVADTGAAAPADDWTPEEGYVSLFNGKDLTGWRFGKENLDGKTESTNKRFQVVGGAIAAREKDANGKGGIADLYTQKSFDKDFHLKLEFRAAPRADSGVYIRGKQLQVRDYPAVGPYKGLKNFKKGDWNELDITVRGGVVVTTVNGKALTADDGLEVSVKGGKVEAKLNGKSVNLANLQVSVGPVALCKCNGEVVEAAFVVPAKGAIGLQAESGAFEFRRIRVKELP